ncbi:MAG: hypothetical protein PHY31_04500 [Smithellaceae bacterium]|nr:hypothetical protein [Smithellaceae bacterium]
MIFGAVMWFGKKVLAEHKAKTEAGLDRASLFLVNDIVESFGNPPREPDGKGGTKANSSKKWKGMFHSMPGQPPYVQTGTLRRSIRSVKPMPLTRYVGSTLKPVNGAEHSYAFYLEMGTSKMHARPYLRPALIRNKSKILQLVTHG